MDKVIKKIRNKDFVYKVGYDLWENKVYPIVEIYKKSKRLAGGYWPYGFRVHTDKFFFRVRSSYSTAYSSGEAACAKDLFIKLRQYNEIPEEVEEKFGAIFLMYKLNNFKEL